MYGWEALNLFLFLTLTLTCFDCLGNFLHSCQSWKRARSFAICPAYGNTIMLYLDKLYIAFVSSRSTCLYYDCDVIIHLGCFWRLSCSAKWEGQYYKTWILKTYFIPQEAWASKLKHKVVAKLKSLLKVGKVKMLFCSVYHFYRSTNTKTVLRSGWNLSVSNQWKLSQFLW